jgi:hypothetical protein
MDFNKFIGVAILALKIKQYVAHRFDGGQDL